MHKFGCFTRNVGGAVGAFGEPCNGIKLEVLVMGCSWGSSSCLEGAAFVGFGELLLPQVVGWPHPSPPHQ